MTPSLAVAVGVLRDAQGRVLLARRPPGGHLAGCWEFPGGKVEPGEGIEGALRRELHEELGIEPLAFRPLIDVPHTYDDRRVVLHTHLVSRWRGEPRGREGQPLRWCRPEELTELNLPPADRPIVTALQLPACYAITPPRIEEEGRFLSRLEALLARGIRLFQLRLADTDLLPRLAEAMLAPCDAAGARLLINGDPALARRLGAHGVHLNGRRLRTTSPEALAGLLVGASCHDADELARARALGAHFAVLSPVRPTASHPEAPPLGWAAFARWVRPAALPVYALGGVGCDDLESAWRHGAQGVAGIGAFW